MSTAATVSVPQPGVGLLIHKGWSRGKPNVDDVSSALRALGFRNASEIVIRYGVVDCAAAMAYVSAQKGRYAARNPGGLVRWVLKNKDSLAGWHWSRVRGFLMRFRSLPEWLRERIARWLGLSALPESPPRKRKSPAKGEASRSVYQTWEEVQTAKARDERRLLQILGRAPA